MKTLAFSAPTAHPWAPAVKLSLSVCVCHGIGRFGYALLMPAMQIDQGWTYELASWLNTANALGYIAGAISCLVALRYLDAGSVFRIGLCGTVLAVVLTGFRAEWWWLLTMRIAAGCGAAWTFAAGGAVVAACYRDSPERSSLASGIFFSGAGIGMALSALVAPTVLATMGAESWPLAWLGLGLVALLAALLPLSASRRIKVAHRPGDGKSDLRAAHPRTYIAPTIAYLTFACAHTAYVFFIFAWANDVGVPWYLAATMWIVLGLGVVATPFLWRRALRRWDPHEVLAACSLQTCVGATLPLMSASASMLFCSAVLVGLSFFLAPTAVAVLVRQTTPEHSWAYGISAFAVIFSIGQALGSWMTGVLADRYSLSVALAVGSAGLLMSAVIAFFGQAHVPRGHQESQQLEG